MISKNFVIVTLYCLTSSIESARILSLFPMPSGSHVILGHELSVALAQKGHQVLMVTPYPKSPKIDNFKEIYLKNLTEEMRAEKRNFFEMHEMSPLKQLIYCYRLGNMVIEGTFKDEQIRRLLNSKSEKFDLVIMDQFYNEALLGIAHHFKAPIVLSSSLDSPPWTHHMVANPDYYSYMPNAYAQLTSRMSFVERLANTAISVGELIYRAIFSFPHHNRVLHRYLPESPHLFDLMYRNVSLILVNTHFSVSEPFPRVPNMIDVAGMHITGGRNLTKDVKQFLDGAEDGAIFFSFGSNLKPSVLPQEKLDALLKTFGKLEQKVLWKWDGEHLPGKPENVFVNRWFSQVDVLAHPNVNAFISHGGLLSTIEAVHFGVPVVGIPIYADQKMNVARLESSGMAIAIDYTDLDENKLTNALDKILHDPKYKLNAEKRSKLMHDRSMSPLDTAVYWVEYVIRHEGAPHLKTSAMDLHWYQIHLLDVIAFLLVASLLTFAIFYSIIVRFVLGGMLKKRKRD